MIAMTDLVPLFKCTPQVEIEAQGAAFEGREGVHVERHRVADDLVEKRLPKIDFALPQHPLVCLALVPPEIGAVGYKRRSTSFAATVFVDQLNAGVKQPPHLVAEPSPVAPRTVAVILHPELSHELGERASQKDLTALGPNRFSRDPSQQQAWYAAEGELGFPPAVITSV